MKPRVWAKAKVKSEAELKNRLDEFFQPCIAEFFYSFFDKEIEITSLDYNQHGNVFWLESIEYCFYDWMLVPGSFRLLIDEEQAKEMLNVHFNHDFYEGSLDQQNDLKEWKDFIYKPEPEVKSKVEEFKEKIKDIGYGEALDIAKEYIFALEEENKRLKKASIAFRKSLESI